MEIRPVGEGDADALWALLEPVIRAGETYALPRDMRRADALRVWLAPGHSPYLALQDGTPVGTYWLRPNQPGGGAHVVNCAYVTAQDAQGKGVARAMLDHSIREARLRGFAAMLFNFVIASNERAVRLWEANGFSVVGRLPGAFRHPREGPVDVLLMHRPL